MFERMTERVARIAEWRRARLQRGGGAAGGGSAGGDRGGHCGGGRAAFGTRPQAADGSGAGAADDRGGAAMSAAGEAMRAAAVAALGRIGGIGRVYDAPPIQAAVPYALVEADVETDWSHKSGGGREVRLAASLFDKGERPVTLRALVGEAEAALGAIGGALGGWRLVSMQHLRTRIVREPKGGWAGVIEFRARLLAGG